MPASPPLPENTEPAVLRSPTAMNRLLDVLLTTEPVQRVRLAQAGLAMLLMAAGVAAMHYFVAVGVAALVPVMAWSAFTLVGMLVFFLLIRSGVSRRWSEPSLTVPQILFALACSAGAYTLLGAGRGAVFPVVMVVLMFGMFVVSPRQMRWLSVYAVLLLGTAMAFMTMTQPRQYPLIIEVGHFLLVATMLPAVSLLAGRLSRMRMRSRQQRVELAQALARLRENVSRDELTGLINKRHMLTLMSQEHQRCVRSGQSFCLALLDVDRFKPINETHGYAVGDAVLSALAQEAQRQVRVSDVLARWGGEEFMLMMSDTRAPLARGGLERLLQRLAALRILHGGAAVHVTLSAGMAEHIAGESLERTLERATAALSDAKALGSGRVVVAS
jgi:diguanylate cyclase (GGDEF)-like protein